VPFLILPEILEHEGSQFYRIDRRWQPKGLLPDPYRRNLLKGAQERLNQLEAATDELQQLDRSPLYVKLLIQMRFAVKRAQFAWRSDDLEFLTQISKFFSNYGLVLQNLKIDQARGRLSSAT
jgi:hypothetical protein